MTHFTRSQLNVISSPAEWVCLSQPVLYRTGAGAVISSRLRAAIIASALRGWESRGPLHGAKRRRCRTWRASLRNAAADAAGIGMRRAIAAVDPDFAQLRIPSRVRMHAHAEFGQRAAVFPMENSPRARGIRFARGITGAINSERETRETSVIRFDVRSLSLHYFQDWTGQFTFFINCGKRVCRSPPFFLFSCLSIRLLAPPLFLPEGKFINMDFVNINWEISRCVQ